MFYPSQLISLFLGMAVAEPDFAARDLFQQARAANSRNAYQPRLFARDVQQQQQQQQLPRDARQQQPQPATAAAAGVGDRRFDNFEFENDFAPPQQPKYRFKQPPKQQPQPQPGRVSNSN